MRAFCLAEKPEATGARFTSFKRQCVRQRCVAWLTPTNLDDLGNDPSIVDTDASVRPQTLDARRGWPQNPDARRG